MPFSGSRTLETFGAWPFDGTLRLAVREPALEGAVGAGDPPPAAQGRRDGGDASTSKGPRSSWSPAKATRSPTTATSSPYLARLRPELDGDGAGWALVAKAPGRPEQRIMTVEPKPDVRSAPRCPAPSRPLPRGAGRGGGRVDRRAPARHRRGARGGRQAEGQLQRFPRLLPAGSTFKMITAAALMKAGPEPAARWRARPRTASRTGGPSPTTAGWIAGWSPSPTPSPTPATPPSSSRRSPACDVRICARPRPSGGSAGRCRPARGRVRRHRGPGGRRLVRLERHRPGLGRRRPALHGHGRRRGAERHLALAPAAVGRGRPSRSTASRPRRSSWTRAWWRACAQMMRAVVEHGTAAAPGFPTGVSGKTGTAEVGGRTAHGWFIGYRDDLAFCVFVRHGGSGRSAAVPIVARFLNGL